MRVLHAPVNIGNQPWVLSRYERKLGVESDFHVNYKRRPSGIAPIRSSARSVTKSPAELHNRFAGGAACAVGLRRLSLLFREDAVVLGTITSLGDDYRYLDLEIARQAWEAGVLHLARLRCQDCRRNRRSFLSRPVGTMPAGCFPLASQKRMTSVGNFLSEILPKADRGILISIRS